MDADLSFSPLSPHDMFGPSHIELQPDLDLDANMSSQETERLDVSQTDTGANITQTEPEQPATTSLSPTVPITPPLPSRPSSPTPAPLSPNSSIAAEQLTSIGSSTGSNIEAGTGASSSSSSGGTSGSAVFLPPPGRRLALRGRLCSCIATSCFATAAL